MTRPLLVTAMWASVALVATDNQALAFMIGCGALVITIVTVAEP